MIEQVKCLRCRRPMRPCDCGAHGSRYCDGCLIEAAKARHPSRLPAAKPSRVLVGARAAVMVLAMTLAGTLLVASPAHAAAAPPAPATSALKVTHPGDAGASASVTPAPFVQWVSLVAVYLYLTQPAMVQQANATYPTLSAACNGANAYYTYWEWFEGNIEVVALDSCKIALVRLVMSGGSGFLGLVAVLSTLTGVGVPVAALAGILASLGAIGNAALGFCSSQGTGTDIRHNTTLGYYWCNNQ